MGEVADLIVDGTICASCQSPLDGESPGHPRQCHACEQQAVQEAQDRQLAKDRRVDAAADQFQEARRLAGDHGMVLRRCTDMHYQLRAPSANSWILNIYPSNRRLYSDRQRRGPFLEVPHDWTLMDVVKAAIGAAAGGETRPAAGL